jgi:hypothetical protein
MQIGRQGLSQLRKKLLELFHPAQEDLGPFLSSHPLVKGTVYTLRRKCSKSSCRCARGEHHETVVLTASIAGKTRLWTIPEERIEEIRQWAEHYRRFRQARARFLKDCAKRQAEMLCLIDAIEKIRTQQP